MPEKKNLGMYNRLHLVEITNVRPLFSTEITTIYYFTPFLKHPPSKLLPNSGSYCRAAKRFIMGSFRVEGTSEGL